MKLGHIVARSFRRKGNSFFDMVGQMVGFSIQFFKGVFKKPFEINELVYQVYTLGYRSLGLTGITGFIVGMVFTMQSYPTMASLGAAAWIPTMISISIVREIGPLITALIFAGKVGSGIGAEIGSMKVTRQIDAMQVSGTNPLNYLVVTRVLATTIAVPLLVIYTDALAFLGSYFALQQQQEISMYLYFSEALGAIEYVDIIPSLVKSAIFGLAIGIVACYKGYNAGKGTTGVGEAANSSVVISSFLIFIIDLIMVQLQNFYM